MKLHPVYVQVIVTSNRGNPVQEAPLQKVCKKYQRTETGWSINAYKPLYFFRWRGGTLSFWSKMKQEVMSRQAAFCLYGQYVMLVCFWLGTRSSQNQRMVKRQAMTIPGRKFYMLKHVTETFFWYNSLDGKKHLATKHGISMCCVSFVVRPSVGSTFNFFRNDVFVLPASLPFRDSLLWRSDLEKNWFPGSKEGEIETFDGNKLLVG